LKIDILIIVKLNKHRVQNQRRQRQSDSDVQKGEKHK